MNHGAKTNKEFYLNRRLCYFSLWFFGLTLAYVFLPNLIGQLFGSLSTDWVSIAIILIGIIAAIIYMGVLSFKHDMYQRIIFPILIFALISLMIALVDFGEGWGRYMMLIGAIIQSMGLLCVVLYGIFVLSRQKAYQLFAEMVIIVLLHAGFTFDAAIIFYPEVYQAVPIFSIISYVLSIGLIHIAYRMTENNDPKEKN